MNAVEFVIGIRDMASEKLNSIAKTFAGTKTSADKLGMSIDGLKSKSDSLRIARNASTSIKEIRKLNKEIKETENKIRRLENLPPAGFMSRIQKLGGGMMGNVGGAIAGIFALNKAKEFGGDVVDITAKFGKYRVVLNNTLQDAAKGEAAMKMIQDFAAATPFQVDELTASYIKMVNRGLNPTKTEMRKLGDLAASQGKSFDQLIEAALDAQTGEFERLKEFGIRAKKQGDQVMFTFKGQTQTVKMTDEAIQDYLYSLGDVGGVSGGMAAISGELEGKLSNLSDTSDSLKVAIGEKLKPAIIFVVDKLKSFYEWATRNVDVLVPIAIGIAGIAVAMGVMSIATWINAKAQNNLTRAIIMQNIAMLASPITWIVIGIIALIAAIIWVTTCTEGWGETWGNIMGWLKLSFSQMGAWLGLQWMKIENYFMSGFETIEKGWYKLKALWDEEGAAQGLAKIEKDRNTRAEQIALQQKKIDALSKERSEMTVWEVKIKDDAKKKETGVLGSALNPIAELVDDNNEDTTKNTQTTEAVASGGTRNSTINITLGNMVGEVVFNGTIEEKKQDFIRAVEDALARVLFAAQSVG